MQHRSILQFTMLNIKQRTSIEMTWERIITRKKITDKYIKLEQKTWIKGSFVPACISDNSCYFTKSSDITTK